MKRCVVQFRDGGYANLAADLLLEKDGMVYAVSEEQNTEKLVGVFDESCILSIYLSEVKQ